jgi:hypothetical protein
MLATKRLPKRGRPERTPEQWEKFNDFCELGRIRRRLRELGGALLLTPLQAEERLALEAREAALAGTLATQAAAAALTRLDQRRHPWDWSRQETTGQHVGGGR